MDQRVRASFDCAKQSLNMSFTPILGGTNETGFYITCPSDTPLPVGEIPNTPSNFTIPMLSTVRLPGHWQVAVTDLQMPLRYDNIIQNISNGTVDDPRFLFKVWVFAYLEKPDENTRKRIIAESNVSSWGGNYCFDLSMKDPDTDRYLSLNTVEDVLKDIQRMTRFNGEDIFQYDEVTGKIDIKDLWTLVIHKNLASMLGFKVDEKAVQHLNFSESGMTVAKDANPYNTWYSMTFSKGTIVPSPMRQKTLNLLKHNSSPDARVTKVYIKRWDSAPDGKQYKHFRVMDLLPKLKEVRLNGDYTVEEVVTSLTDLVKQYLDVPEQTKLGGFVPKRTDAFYWAVKPKHQIIISKPLAEKVLKKTFRSVALTSSEQKLTHAPQPNTYWHAMNYGFNLIEKAKVLDAVTTSIHLPSKIDLFTQSTSYPLKKYDNHFHSIYVNTDLIQAHPVGNVNANVLRVLKVSETQTLVQEEFAIRHYYNLRVNEFNKITVVLTTDTGDKIPINNGVVSLTLHFKRIA